MRTIVPRKVSSCLGNFLRAVTKPQRAYLLIYLVGLIWLVKFRSIREIAAENGHVLSGQNLERNPVQDPLVFIAPDDGNTI